MERYIIAGIQILNRFATGIFFVHPVYIACFYIADIRSINKVTIFQAEFQQARGFAVVAANVQRKFIIDIDPDVIIAGEEELDGNLGLFVGAIDLAIFVHRKLEFQLSAKPVVVCRRLMIRRALVEGEEAKGPILMILRVDFRLRGTVSVILTLLQEVVVISRILLEIKCCIVTVEIPVLNLVSFSP